jgi:photosystem II stability/assembly factor-like uncharacterized protein
VSSTTAHHPTAPGPLTDPAAADEAEALFKEARRRRRRRRAAALAVIALAAALVAAGLVLAGGHGSNGRATGGVHHNKTPKAPGRPQQTNPGATEASYPPVQVMGQANTRVTWAATGNSLEVSTDSGTTWRSVTPTNLQGMSVSEHITAVDAVGTDALWVVLEDVPGLVPYGQSANGSDRGEGVDRSTDGGRTWTFGALPEGCLQTCGPISVSFVDADHGFAATSPQAGSSTLFATQDGGATWSPIGPMPNLGSVNVGGPLATSQLLFTGPLDGWALSGPSGYGARDAPTNPGGALFRTTDGGASWSAAPGLPTTMRYVMPVFFPGASGVVLATPAGGGGAVAYVTTDAGATWAPYSVPSFPGAHFKAGSIATRFAAVDAQTWRVDVGSRLYETDDAGRTWSSLHPAPNISLGGVWGLSFSSARDGMAIGDVPWCSETQPLGTLQQTCFPTLLVTSDGGRRWNPATF